MKRTQLVENIKAKGSFLCVGLDTDLRKVPECIKGSDAERMLAFNKAIVEATAPYCVAYKPNTAFYECMGATGWQVLAETVKYIRDKYPDQFIIADAKRGDIGNTSSMYARAFFEDMDVHALTVAPYMGEDSVKPFLAYEDKWVILLALTSNKGSQDFQMIYDKNGHYIFERVLKRAQHWGTPVNLMFVVGATQGKLFEDVRRVAPRNFLLVPGVGAQGGSLEEVCRYGMNDECGLLVNSSRGIIYASSGEDFAEKAASEAEKLAKVMRRELIAHGVIEG